MISISTCFNYDYTIDEQIKMIKEAGFKSFSVSGKYSHNGLMNKPEELIELIRSSGLKVDSIHGCNADDDDAFKMLERCSIVASSINCPIIVIHPCSFFITENEVEEKYNNFLRLSHELILLAQKYNVKYAIENLHPDSATEVLKKALDVLDERYFGMCYDITHAQIDGPRECDLLKDYGDRIIAVHISDRIKEFVDHVVPGEGFINFEPFIKKLHSINYKGSLLLEVLTDFTKYKDGKELLDEALRAGRNIETKLASYQLNVT